MGDRADRLSASGMGAYRNCPLSWWLTYVEEHPAKAPTWEMVLGTFVHRILERLMAAEPWMRTLDEAKRIARDVWEGPDGEAIWGSLGPEVLIPCDEDSVNEDLHRFRWEAAWCLEKFVALAYPHELEVVGVEVNLACELGGVPFVGFADLVADDVIDYKTGEMPETGKPWSAQKAESKLLQPLLYAAALREQGIRVNRGRLLFLSPHGRTGWLDAEATDEALDGAVAALLVVWRLTRRDLARGHAEAHAGPLCGWCDHLEVCDEGQRAVRVRIRQGKNVGPGAEVCG